MTPSTNTNEDKEPASAGCHDAACSASSDDFEARMMEMDIHELRSRILTQRDYMRRFHACLDGLKIPADCNASIDGCRTQHDIRSIVEKLISRRSSPFC